MSAVGTCDIHVYRGDDLTVEFAFAEPAPNAWTIGAPIDLTGWAFTAQWRSAPDAEDPVNFTTTVSALTGVVTIRLTEAQTAALSGDGWFDLQGVKDGETRTWVRGRALLTKDVTR